MTSKVFPALYKFDTKGKVREWVLIVDEDKYYTYSGLLDGEKVEQAKTCKGKNKGKANATTANTQALKEGEARWLKQIRIEDYARDVVESGLQLRPMLALDYRKVPNRVDWWDVMCQNKLDGLRLLGGYRYVDGNIIHLMSRKGVIYPIPHFQHPTEKLMMIINGRLGHKCQALDGEAYIHGMKLQKITSLAKKNKPESFKLKYYLFDLVIFDMPFFERYEILKQALDIYNSENEKSPFVLVETKIIKSDAEMKEFHGEAISSGFEGAILRHSGGLYKKGRSADLFKYKEFFDVECKIVDVKEDSNGNGMFVVIAPNGEPLDVTPKRTHEERKEILANAENYIGMWLTVKYQALTESGNLQFPVGLDIRECTVEGKAIY